jgi:hypothetical protein
MDRQELEQDNELATFTDDLLERDAELTSCERPPLASTVETLARVLEPETPPEALRRRIRRSVAKEWHERQPSLWERFARRFSYRTHRRALVAAVAALTVLAIASILILPSVPDTAVGTAAAGAKWFSLVAGALLLLHLIVSWLRSRR